MPAGTITACDLEAVWTAFHAAHEAEYGHAFPASPIEIVNIRASGVGRMHKLETLRPPQGGSIEAALIRKDACVFRVNGRLQSFETTFYQRALLPVGASLTGPAIVLQTDSTTVIPPAATAMVDAIGNIIIRLGKVLGDAA